jgi:hypothetical protein
MFGLICLGFSQMINPVSADDNWVIDGNRVYIDDSLVYASASPHTLSGSGDVVFEFKSKVYTGAIDLCWGFNTEYYRPSGIWLWQNISHTTNYMFYQQDWGSTVLSNVVSFVSLGIANYDDYNVTVGNRNNTYLYSVLYSVNKTGVYAFSQYSKVGSTYTLSGNYSHFVEKTETRSYFDWQKWDVSYTHIKKGYGGMTDWYLITGQNIISDVTYKCKIHLEIQKYSIGRFTGKYWFAFKPTSETLDTAIGLNHLYYLDPWYDSGWSYCKKIVIDHTKVLNTLTNFPVLFDNTSSDYANAQADGDDFVFVNSDNTTKYNHEIESFSSNRLIAWVNITTLSSVVDTVVWLYYGNSGCSFQQNKIGTWNAGYKVVLHMNGTTTIQDSTGNNHDGATSSDEATGFIGKAQSFTKTSSDYINMGDANDFSFGDSSADIPFTWSCWMKPVYTYQSATQYYPLFNKFSTNNWEYQYYYATDSDTAIRKLEVLICDESSDKYQNAYTTIFLSQTAYNYVTLTYSANERASGLHFYINGTEVSRTCTNQTGYVAMENKNAVLVVGLLTDCYYGGLMDECRISNVERNASWVNTSYLNQNSPSTFLSVSDYYYRDWVIVDLQDIDYYQTGQDIIVNTTIVQGYCINNSLYYYYASDYNLSWSAFEVLVDWNTTAHTGYSLTTFDYPEGVGWYRVFVRGYDNDSYNQSDYQEFVCPMRTPLPLGGGTSQGWNLVSLPKNEVVAKTLVRFVNATHNYTWNEAVTNGVSLDFLYGWSRPNQNYVINITFDPYCGYWIYLYKNDYRIWINVTAANGTDWLYLRAILSIDDSQFYLLILISLWAFFIFLYEEKQKNIYALCLVFLGLPLGIIISGIAYYNSYPFGYLISFIIILISFLIPAYNQYKGKKK